MKDKTHKQAIHKGNVKVKKFNFTSYQKITNKEI